MKSASSRVVRTKTQARQNYNRLSRWYDVLAGSSEARYREMGIRSLAIQPGEKVLEIGCGTGTSLLTLAELVGVAGGVWGFDLSDGMAKMAQERVAGAGLGERVRVCLADGAWLPFTAGFFDAVFMSFTLELFDTPEIPRVLAGCQRVLHPGGRLGVLALGKTEPPGLAERVYEWCHQRMPVLVDCRPIEVRREIETAGFVVRSERRGAMWGLPVVVVTGEVGGQAGD